MLTEYLRQKRIRRILRFYSHLQSYGVVFMRGAPVEVVHRKTVLVSRDAVLHFVLTVICMMIIGGVLGSVMQMVPATGVGAALWLVVLAVSGVAAVECADAVMDRMTRAFDITFDYVIPIAVLLVAGGLWLGVRVFGRGPSWSASFDQWRASTNQRLASRPRSVSIVPAQGNNWYFVRNAKGQLQPLSRSDAMLECEAKGAGWVLFNGDSTFVPDPVPTLDRGMSVWMDGGMPIGQIGPGPGLPRPSVFVSGGPDAMAVTLCVKPEPR